MRSLVFLLLLLAFRRSYADNDGKLWCVAKNNAEDTALQSAIDWACGPAGGADCIPIQQGGPCFDPQDLQSHASWAFNDYFVRNGFQLSACDFSGTAAVISLNPSRDKCIFPASSSATNGSISGSTTDSIPGAMDSLNGATSLSLKNWLSTLLFSMVIVTATHSALSRPIV